MTIQALILAGGLATRLKPLTEKAPKALIPIEGKPFIHYQLKWLSQHQIRDVVLCVGHLSEKIEEYVQNGSQYDLNIRYSYETKLLGTAGAVKNAEKLLDEYFFVLNGDSYLPISPIKPIHFFLHSNHLGLLTVLKNNNEFDESNIALENDRVLEYQRGVRAHHLKYIDYGMQFFKKEVLELIPAGIDIDMGVLYQKLIEKKELAAYKIKTPFYDIGSHEGLERFRQYVIATRLS